MPSLGEKIKANENQLAPGHRTCAGCAIPPIIRTVMAGSDKPLIVSNATGCLEVTTTIYPQTAWEVPYIHSAFENAAATISGIESAYKYLKKKGLKKEYNFLAIGGDGGTYDIGLQAISGALERRHNFTYLCYDNEGYMNTGGQRSGATPRGASTTTEPAGSERAGKLHFRKNFLEIAIAHDIEYAAQASINNPQDLYQKAQKAFNTKGPSVLLVFSPCVTLWKFADGTYPKISELAVETRFWPLYEYEKGKYKVNYIPRKYTPIDEFMSPQKRFKHLFKTKAGKEIVKDTQKRIDDKWEKLLRLAEGK